MTRGRHRRGTRLHGDAGMSMIELITAMAVSSILGAMTLFVFVSLNSASSSSVDRSLSATQARVILSSWSGLLQVAESPLRDTDEFPAFEKITSTAVTFYASVNNRSTTSTAFTLPTRVSLFTEDGDVIEERFQPTATGWPTTPTVRRVLAESAQLHFDAVDASGVPVGQLGAGYDTYCRTTGSGSTLYSGLCSTAACAESAACAGVTGADALLARVATVRISLTVTDGRGTAHSYSSAAGVTG